MQTNCSKCTRALHNSIEREGVDRVTPDQLGRFSMKHSGVCYRNSTLAPASAEEHQAAIAARDLLLDKDGKYLGDDQAVFCMAVNADNDTRGSVAMIAGQASIIGTPADEQAEHVLDNGHVYKCQNNAIFNARAADKSLSGKHGLTNPRIRSLVSDINAVMKEYGEKEGDDAARKECLDQIEAIVPHHCGMHEKCKHERWCNHLKVRNAHPDWSDEQVAAEALRTSARPDGNYMSLSPSGIAFLTALIQERFNGKTINRIAAGGCSNLSENFWSTVTKFSEGKRLCVDLTDAWEVINKLKFCRMGEGNVEKTNNDVARKLCLPVTTPERKFRVRAKKKRNAMKARQQTDRYKHLRAFAKMTREKRMGKEDSKKAHRSGKVPLGESAKYSSEKNVKQRKPTRCSMCKQVGHQTGGCKMPPPPKRKPLLLHEFYFSALELCDRHAIKENKRRKKVQLADDWVV